MYAQNRKIKKPNNLKLGAIKPKVLNRIAANDHTMAPNVKKAMIMQ
jgi:hypothetical protein